MKLRLESLWVFVVFVVIWLMHIKDVCHALEVQRYPDGVTARDAIDKCGASGLENELLVLKTITKLNGHAFWTGLGKFTQLTPWIEILGCFQLSKKPSTKRIVKSVGYCQRECSTTGYFTYNKENSACSCLNKNENQFTKAANLSSCLLKPTKSALVYEIYNGTTITSSARNRLCTTLTCVPAVDMRASPCKSNYSIHGLCEDGKQPSLPSSWGFSQNQTSEHCWHKDKLLLHSNACQYLPFRTRAWTNVFREEIEEERLLDDGTAIPEFCLSANMSDNGILTLHRQNCSSRLEWFVCKKDSTAVTKTYYTDKATESNYGVILGGSIGAVTVLLIGFTVALCKVRRVGFFKNNTSTETTKVVFKTSVNGKDPTLGVQTPQHVNQSYGLVDQIKETTNKINDSYAQVQKVKRTEDTYTESTNGEYDHLHNIDGRKLNTSENTYDSNAGVVNRNDPTYDTSASFTRADMDNTYDHSFTNLKTYSEYDVSDSRGQIGGANYDAYDQAC